MPNTIQIRGSQIQAATVEASNINLSGSFDLRAASSFICAAPSAASDVANKAYVDGQLPDAFSGGDGIVITDSDPDVIAVDLATNPGLQFSSNKLDLKLFANKGLVKDANGLATQLKSESGGTISVDASGLFIADAGISSAKLAGSIANAKLANSTISGKALGTSLDALAAGQGLAIGSAFDGSAGQTMDLNLDGATLAKSASGVKIADLGVGSGQIAADAVTAGKIADGAVDASSTVADGIIVEAKLGFQSRQDIFSPNGSTLAFVLANEVNALMANMVIVFKNGLSMRKVASNPADADQYTVSTAAGTTTITFGANLAAEDTLEVRSLA